MAKPTTASSETSERAVRILRPRAWHGDTGSKLAPGEGWFGATAGLVLASSLGPHE